MARVAQTRFGDRGRLDPGKLYQGVVTDYDVTSGNYSVDVGGDELTGCGDMVGPAGSFFGMRFQQRIPTGTRVLLVMGAPPWIINTGTIEIPDRERCHSRVMQGTHVRDIVQDMAGQEDGIPSAHFPNDLLEGELSWERVNGPMLRLLLGMVALGANDRSQIECLLHRELVRLTSRNFEHFAATGDIKNYDDGRLNQEEHGTCYEHERYGTKEGEPILEAPEEPVDFDEWVDKTMRARWSKYVGFLGDIVNFWVTDPQEAIGQMATGQFRSGKARVHIGHDGTLLMQSTADIVLERVVRIPVPVRLKHEEDPQGVVRERMRELDKKFEEQWEWASTNPQDTAFMLRDYSRYLSQFQSMARFLQMADMAEEFEIPSEAETPEPMTVDPDRIPALYYDTYATIRIFRDGSIVNSCGYGNATYMGPYGIIHSSIGDYTVYASRDINLKAGRSMHLSARRNVELVAHRGALLLKGRTALRALVEKGVLWFKSDFNPDYPYIPEEGDPEAEVHGEAGVLIHGLQSTMVLDAKNLQVQAAEELKVIPQKLTVIAPEVVLHARSSLRVYSSKLLFSISRIIGSRIGSLWVKDQVKLTGGMLEVKGLTAHVVRALTALASKTGTVAKFDSEYDLLEAPEPEEEATVPDPPEAVIKITAAQNWDMLPPEEYAPLDFLYEPLTQQRLRLGEKLHPIPPRDTEIMENFSTWSGMADSLMASQKTGSGRGWPGDDAQWYQYAPHSPELAVPAGAKGEAFKPVPSSLTTNSIVFHYQKS